jgi:hypothetical protein
MLMTTGSKVTHSNTHCNTAARGGGQEQVKADAGAKVLTDFLLVFSDDSADHTLDRSSSSEAALSRTAGRSLLLLLLLLWLPVLLLPGAVLVLPNNGLRLPPAGSTSPDLVEGAAELLVLVTASSTAAAAAAADAVADLGLPRLAGTSA